ncbi:MAG TPA: helix-turn-helix transcriptional regulator [Pseudonocardiaceae bacterium]|jgi:transcriptional regulator with XRE-family HTH domain|nr:helix-turn-helix transcriptional regulator [Pseudonocardiaceae bacterium]
MSKSHLDRIERGERTLDKLSKIVALANALQIAPGDLMRLPVPAPANGHTDSTTEAVRLALDAIDIDHPSGLALPVTVLRDQVTQIHSTGSGGHASSLRSPPTCPRPGRAAGTP